MPLDPGVVLNQRYRILSILGQGGMGAVYHALDLNLGVNIALKENLYLSDEFARQFKREAAILATLKHPNLPRVSDHFEIKGQGQYLVMDYMDGEDLRVRMDRVGVLSDSEAVTIGAAICDAMDYLHTRQPAIIHRDIKPGNIRIAADGHISLVDFGLAKLDMGDQETSTGARAMTPGYSPPEQYGQARTDPRSDVYSLGATLYSALCGCPPEDSLSRATGYAHLTSIRKHNPNVSKKLAAVIDHALDIHPEKRYQTALEMKKALMESIGEKSTDSRVFIVVPPPLNTQDAVDPSSRPIPNSKPIRSSQGNKLRRSLLTFLKAVIIILLVIAIAGSATIYILNYQKSRFIQVPSVTAAARTTLEAISSGNQSTPLPDPTNRPKTATSIAKTPTSTAKTNGNPAIINELPATISPPVIETQQVTGEIAFVSMRTGIPQIWLMDAQGESLRQITDLKAGACQPDWSHDGKKLVFISPCYKWEHIYPKANLFIMDADGSNVTELTVGYGGNYDPRWSPDNKMIAFTKNISGSTQVQIYNLEDGTISAASDDKYPSKQPAWSHDGKYLAYILTRYSGEIWIRDNQSGTSFQYTHTKISNNSWPVWSPSKDEIIFTQSSLDKFLPWLASIDFTATGNSIENKIPRENHPVPAPACNADVSSDGRWLVFESWPEAGNHDIYIMTFSGENVYRLTNDKQVDFQPVWRP